MSQAVRPRTRKPRLLRTQCTATSPNGLRVTVIIPHPPREGVDNKVLKAQLRADLKPAAQKLAGEWDRFLVDTIREAGNG